MAMSRMSITSLVDNVPPPPLSVLSLLNPLPAPVTENISIFSSRKRHFHSPTPLYKQQQKPKRPKVSLTIPISPAPQPSSPTSSPTASTSSSSSSFDYYPTSPSSPVRSLGSPVVYKSEAERFAASRIIGQKHRDKEDASLDYLRRQVDNLITKNEALRSSTKRAMESYTCRSALKKQNTGNCAKYEISHRTAKVLGTSYDYYWTGAACLVLLEIVAIRRNLVSFSRDANKRRRKNVLECPPDATIFESMLRNYYHNCNNKKANSDVPWTAMLAAHERWSKYEENVMDAIVTSVFLPEQSVSQSANQHGHKKECSRCGKDKTAGSGHPRSHCDDGMEVSSHTPYGGRGSNSTSAWP